VNVTWSWRRFWYGTAGAAAPEVVRLFKLLKEQHAAFTFHDLTLGMVLISLAFVTLGGVLRLRGMMTIQSNACTTAQHFRFF
jgi:hypothetical protein